MDVQWFPGHMAKTRRLLAEQSRQADCLLELRDARIPFSSENPEIAQLTAPLPRLLIFTKADLADPEAMRQVDMRLQEQGETCLFLNLLEAREAGRRIRKALESLQSAQRSRAEQKGRQALGLRLLLGGIPNCGKSTLINALAGRRVAKKEDRPGVTRALQRVSCPGDLTLIDVPGLMLPKLETEQERLCLAACGAVKDELLNMEELAMELLCLLIRLYPEALQQRYKLELPAAGELDLMTRYALLEQAALARACVRRGGLADVERFSRDFVHEFRQGVLGRMSLEQSPPPRTLKEGGNGHGQVQ